MQANLQNSSPQDILTLYDARMLRHLQFNEKTEKYYRSLVKLEREKINAWLSKNFKSIPILTKTKKTGLEEIYLGQINSNSALLLIRYALKNFKQVKFE